MILMLGVRALVKEGLMVGVDPHSTVSLQLGIWDF